MFQASPLSGVESASLKRSKFSVGRDNTIEENQDREADAGKKNMWLAAVSQTSANFPKV